MGNRANRKKAQQLLNSWGFRGKMWTGKLSFNRKNFVAKSITNLFSYKIGDLVSDCDGFNHIIKGLVDFNLQDQNAIIRLRDGHPKGVRIASWNMPQFLYEDGRYSCGCNASPDRPFSREEIEAYFLSMDDEYIAVQTKNGWWDESNQKKVSAVRAGIHICDERGIIYPEYQRS